MKKLSLKNIVLALIFALSVIAFACLLADLLYRPGKIVKRGFEVEIVAKNDVPNSGSKDSKTISKKAAAPIDIASMIKKADLDNGAKIFKKCATCHTIEKGGANKIGPNLYSVVGRKRAAIANFSYSEAMRKKGGSWNIEELNQFITSPKAFVPGTKMPFAGLKKDQDRANVIAYLEKMGK